MIIYIILLVLIIIFILCFTYIRGINKSYKNFIDLPYYQINQYSFINGVFYKTKSHQLLLHGYSPNQNISFNNCYLIYDKRKEACFPKFLKSNTIDYFYFNVQINLLSTSIPKSVILNDVEMVISLPVVKKYKYVVCSPVLVNFNRETYLIQHIESMIEFGVSKIVTYYVSSTPNVMKILQYYVNEGILEMNRYNVTIEEIWKGRYYGEVWKLNHCFHKYQEVSKYIIQLDFDEVLWPVVGKNYDELFSKLPSFDIYFLHARIFPPSNTVVEFKHDKDMNITDVDMFKINISCQTQNGFARKYVVANPLKISCLEIHNIACHSGITQTTIDYKYAYDKHTRHLNPGILQLCPTFIKNEMDDISKKINEKSKRVKSSLI